MKDFKWTRPRQKAAIALALGATVVQAAEAAGVTERAVYKWKNDVAFMSEVDRLTLMSGISLRAERLRIAMRAIRQKMDGDKVKTQRDLLDWLKFAQGETDGIKLDFAALLANDTAVDGQ